MSDLLAFYEDLQEKLNLEESYLASSIPRAVERAVKRLLRDYHFPKADRSQVWNGLVANQQEYELPEDWSKERIVYFRQAATASVPLRRRDGYMLPGSDGIPRYYWVEGLSLWVDVKVPAEDASTLELVMVYRSNDYATNVSWMLADMPDVLLSFCMFRLAAEFNKPEILTAWSALWTEDQRSIAVYAHEQEYNNMDIVMREGDRSNFNQRYPGGA